MVLGMGAGVGRTLIGRDTQLAGVDRVLREVADGSGGTAWIQGEPGIGKSALVDVMAATSAELGCTVLRAGGNRATEAFALRLLADCLGVSSRSPDPARAEIAGLLSGEPGVPTGPATVDPVLAATDRMLELVDRLCAAQPVLLVTEDLQWADEASLLAWNRLARSVDQIPLLLVGTCRPVPERPTVARLRDLLWQRGDLVVELGPLDAAEVARLAGQLVGAVPGPRLSAELARTGGNPLYVRELVAGLVREGLLEVADGVAELSRALPALPHSLTAVVARNLGMLSDPTRRTLRAVAVLGTEFDASDLGLATGRPIGELSDAVDEAVAAGMLVAGRRRLTFRHEVIRQVLVDQTSAPMRVVLHDHMARVVAEADGSFDVVARHLLAISDVLRPWAMTWLAGTRESTLYAAPQVAADLLTRALAGLTDSDPRWEPLAVRLAQVLFWLGRDEEASTIAETVLAGTTDTALAVRMRIQLARSAGRLGQLAAALDVVAPAGDDVRLPLAGRARLRAWEAMVMTYLGRTEEARARAHDALADAEQAGDPLGTAYAWHALAPLAPDASTQVAHIDRAVAALGHDAESTEVRMMLVNNRVGRLAAAGSAEVDQALAEALVLAERVGSYRSATIVASAAEISFFRGRWDDAVLYVESIDRTFTEHRGLTYLQGLVALIALHREDGDLAERHLSAVGVAGPEDCEAAGVPQTYLIDALATRAEINGDLRRAMELRRSWLALGSGPRRSARCYEAPLLIRLALATGDTATATATAAECREHLDATDDWALAARCGLALLNDDICALREVAEGYQAYGWPLWTGFALEELAVRLAEAADARGARTALADAVGAYAGTGASWDIHRAQGRLRRYGIRQRRPAVQPPARTGWSALTPAEQRVAGLVARGLSNPDIAAELFLSRNTVQTHVSRILAKLQLRSRIELVRAVMAGAGAGGPGAAGVQ